MQQAPPTHPTPPSSQRRASAIGIVALVLWSISAVINTELAQIPIFEILGFMLSFSFMAAAIGLTVTRRWHRLRVSPLVWLVTVAGIYGNDILYITSFKLAPAAHVDLLNYLWPILVVCFASFLPGEHFSSRYLAAAGLGFLAIYVLLYHETGGVAWHYMPGYLAAMGAAMVWTAYILITRYLGQIPVEMITIACGVGALASWGLHAHSEAFVVPSIHQLSLLLIMSLGAHLAAYFCWQYGLNFGNYKLLSILSYFTAVLSILLLVLFGKAEATIELFLAFALVVVGTMLCETGQSAPAPVLDIEPEPTA